MWLVPRFRCSQVAICRLKHSALTPLTSLISFAFILELENLFGLVFDENNLDVEELHNIQSVAAVVLASQTQSDEVRDEPGL